jgi:hypothetical protein
MPVIAGSTARLPLRRQSPDRGDEGRAHHGRVQPAEPVNKNWGWSLYPNLNSPITIGYGGINAATGKETLNLSTITSPNFQGTFNRDDLRSRWQAQFGARVRF